MVRMVLATAGVGGSELHRPETGAPGRASLRMNFRHSSCGGGAQHLNLPAAERQFSRCRLHQWEPWQRLPAPMTGVQFVQNEAHAAHPLALPSNCASPDPRTRPDTRRPPQWRVSPAPAGAAARGGRRPDRWQCAGLRLPPRRSRLRCRFQPNKTGLFFVRRHAKSACTRHSSSSGPDTGPRRPAAAIRVMSRVNCSRSRDSLGVS